MALLNTHGILIVNRFSSMLTEGGTLVELASDQEPKTPFLNMAEKLFLSF